MQIKVLLFGQLKDIIGKDTENLELQTGSRLSDLMAHYASQFSKFKPMAGSIACSVNQEYATSSRQLHDGDEVGLLPLAGRLATTLYTVGIVGVGLLAIPTLTGSAAYAFAEALGWKQGLDKRLKQARSFYLMILASTVAAVIMDFTRISPVKALYWTAVINGVLAPFLLVAILMIASDNKLMNGQASSRLGRVIVGITTLAMFIAAIAMFLG